MKRFCISLCVVLFLVACEKVVEEPQKVVVEKKESVTLLPTGKTDVPAKAKASRSVLDNGMVLVVLRQPS